MKKSPFRRPADPVTQRLDDGHVYELLHFNLRDNAAALWYSHQGGYLLVYPPPIMNTVRLPFPPPPSTFLAAVVDGVPTHRPVRFRGKPYYPNCAEFVHFNSRGEFLYYDRPMGYFLVQRED